jgi:hypothetical protein
MNRRFSLRIDEITLSQLYVSSAKLDLVLGAFEEKREHELEPIPIKELDGNLVATDGHTRLLAWFLKGYKEVACVWEDIEMDRDAYRICVQWCKDEGIESVANLQERVVGPEQYQILWLDRCRVMQNELAEKRKMNQRKART